VARKTPDDDPRSFGRDVAAALEQHLRTVAGAPAAAKLPERIVETLGPHAREHLAKLNEAADSERDDRELLLDALAAETKTRRADMGADLQRLADVLGTRE
jgi:hypothetical protein